MDLLSEKFPITSFFSTFQDGHFDVVVILTTHCSKQEKFCRQVNTVAKAIQINIQDKTQNKNYFDEYQIVTLLQFTLSMD